MCQKKHFGNYDFNINSLIICLKIQFPVSLLTSKCEYFWRTAIRINVLKTSLSMGFTDVVIVKVEGWNILLASARAVFSSRCLHCSLNTF